MESALVNLESTHMRIGPGFSIILAFLYDCFGIFWGFKATGAMGEKNESEIDRAS